MQAIQLNEFGPVENLQLVEVSQPPVGPEEVLVKIRSSGVCYRDTLDRQGAYPFMKLPIIPGHEFAGEIVTVGEQAPLWQPGDRVVNLHSAPCGRCPYCLAGEENRCSHSPYGYGYGIQHDGSYAEYIAAHMNSLVRLPEEIPFEQAPFLMCTAGVAWRALRKHGQLQARQRLLITGASGGVGIHAIQLGKILGAEVVAVTTSPAKVKFLQQYGADEVLLDRDGNFHKQLKDPVDVALDLLGKPSFNSSLRSLKPLGRLILVGNVLGEQVTFNPGLVILKEYTLTGSSGATRQEVAEVLELVRQQKLKPVVADTLPLSEARQAQERLQKKQVVGRIVLIPG